MTKEGRYDRLKDLMKLKLKQQENHKTVEAKNALKTVRIGYRRKWVIIMGNDILKEFESYFHTFLHAEIERMAEEEVEKAKYKMEERVKELVSKMSMKLNKNVDIIMRESSINIDIKFSDLDLIRGNY